MEGMGPQESVNLKRFYSGKRVFITGHTGFKGTWLALWLHKLGAEVTGFALSPPTVPSLFEIIRLDRFIHSINGDIRDIHLVISAMEEARPQIVFHLAAQPLVGESYQLPVDTYATNVMGTVNLLEAVRRTPSVQAVVNVTTDKVYKNREWYWGYRENEPLGGADPYSSSKACSELVTSAYGNSFFPADRYGEHGRVLATARAGNVIGGGDWAKNRLIPDCLNALLAGHPIIVRSPEAIRPWQHVLEPLYGYLLLAKRMVEHGPEYGGAWNFGPYDFDMKPVKWLVNHLCNLWNKTTSYKVEKTQRLKEATFLKLDSSKARSVLGWRPKWPLTVALEKTVQWTRKYSEGEDMLQVCLDQIEEYSEAHIFPFAEL